MNSTPFPPGLGPCRKQRVVATAITMDGQRFTGTNDVARPQETCPRDQAGYARGEGYHLCIIVCEQPAHAEYNAMAQAHNAGADLVGAKIYLEGHTAPCAGCKAACDAAEIGQIIVGAPPA